MTEVARPRILVVTAPSGAGKTTIARRIMAAYPQLRFSVSVTTRPPRPGEVDGEAYHFLSEEAFRERLAEDDLLEYEEVYPGRFYGTLRSEVDRATPERPVLLDVEVKGAFNVKERFGDDAFILFIEPPSEDVLAQRLRGRGTESEETLAVRMERARMELAQADKFDAVVVNDDLETAVEEALAYVGGFLQPASPAGR